ncbi:sigma-54-dependent Fis family transcriptional regulator [Ectothiorhodospiraceae bacterium 2226]|nr:sigma-54-dependent Fis family transcriptional regulator [Ectothiorhodospiraceae bacterium 2226]
MPAEGPRILLVDDDPVTGIVMQRQCARAGYHCRVFQSAQAALDAFAAERADLLVTDLRMPHMNGFEFLERVRAVDPDVPILVMTGYSSIETAVESMKRGANDFIKKPFNFAELNVMIERTLQAKRARGQGAGQTATAQRTDRYHMIGQAPAMQRLFHAIERVAPTQCPVLITGEAGTGKTLVAGALHAHGARPDGPFVALDCGAVPRSLIESELFGHERGALPGAQQRKAGVLEQASGGTLFLDEIAALPATLQAALARAIETQRLTRLGARAPVAIDVRIVGACNRDLWDLAAVRATDQLDHQLYRLLDRVRIDVPALQERREDIPALVQHFVEHFAARYNRQVRGFDAASLQRLCAHAWPGNVRELRTAVERCVILAAGTELAWPAGGQDTDGPGQIVFPEDNFPSLDEIERQYIEHVLERAGGKKTRAARILEINKTTLWRKLRRNQPDS